MSSLFIYSWTLRLFHTLAIVNRVAMNIGVHVFFSITVFIFLDVYPEMELLGHMAVLFLAS